MKKLTMTVLMGFMLLAAGTPVWALGPLDVDAGLALNGKYVWRGQVLTPDPVLQPEILVSLLGFSAGFWGNMDTNEVNGENYEFNEIDYTLGYELSLPLIALDAGFIHYSFPNSDLDNGTFTGDFPNSNFVSTTEFYVGAAVNVLLSPSLKVYQDIDEFKGAYWEAGISHGVALSPTTNLDLAAGLGLGSQGYIEGYFGPATLLPTVPELPGNAAMTDYHLSAGVAFHPVPLFTLTPSITYSSLTGDVKDIVKAADGAVYHGDSDAVIWGLSAMFSF